MNACANPRKACTCDYSVIVLSMATFQPLGAVLEPARALSIREEWFRHGRLHRDDGPAAIYPDGRRVWFLEGQKVREERSARHPSLVKAR